MRNHWGQAQLILTEIFGCTNGSLVGAVLFAGSNVLVYALASYGLKI